MKITAKVFKNKGDGAIKANASITFDEEFVVTGLKIVSGSKGLFVSMPSQKNKDGDYKDTAYPITKEFRQKIIDVVLKVYNGDDDSDDSGFPY